MQFGTKTSETYNGMANQQKNKPKSEKVRNL